jgi:hypothetical protein
VVLRTDAIGVVDEDENLSHEGYSFSLVPDQMNLRAARNAASLAPPSPSSVTISPCSRGGRFDGQDLGVGAAEADLTGVDAQVGQLHVSTGFFLAAMIPLKEG